MVFIVLSILNHLFKGTMILPSFVTIGKWTNTLLTILFYTALVFVGVKVFRHFNKKRKFSRANIYEIDRMTGEQFEHYLGFLFTKLGYKTKVTPYSGDYGADVVLVKDGITTVVQAKRYKGIVGNKAVQEIVASMSVYNAQKALVVTNSRYSINAIQLAKANGVELWDRTRLVNELSKINMKKEFNNREAHRFLNREGNYKNVEIFL
jgi:restriction system protein